MRGLSDGYIHLSKCFGQHNRFDKFSTVSILNVALSHRLITYSFILLLSYDFCTRLINDLYSDRCNACFQLFDLLFIKKMLDDKYDVIVGIFEK